MLEKVVLHLGGLEPPALERRGLGVADGVLHAALAIGIPHARRVGDDTVVRQRGGVHRIDLGLVPA